MVPTRSSESSPSAAISILVVDDDELSLQVVSRRLLRDGYLVTMATGGAAALATLERQRFDLVLLDLEMPDMDGLATLKRIRTRSARQDVPVIMLSAHNDDATKRNCLAQGAADYLVKPLVMPIVRERIERCLTRTLSSIWKDDIAEPAAEARILIVDDDNLSCRLLVRQLAGLGYAAEGVGSGRAALAQLAQASFDMVLLDIQMPDLGGREILRRMRAGEKTRETPVIMVTAASDVPTMLACIDQGADGYVTKPVDVAYLNTCILASLEAKRLGPQLPLG